MAPSHVRLHHFSVLWLLTAWTAVAESSDDMLTGCCRGRDVPSNCLHLCSRTEEITLFDFLQCQDHLSSASYCLRGGEDRSPCCRQRGVPDLCLGFCSGDMLTMDSSHIACVPHIQDLAECIQLPPTGVGTSAVTTVFTTLGPVEMAAPGSPRNLTAVRMSSSSIQLTWLPPAGHMGDITHYVVRYLAYGTSIFQQVTQAAANGTSVVLAALSPNTTYQFQVTARSPAGTSLPSKPVVQSTAGDVVDVGLPGRPRNLQAVQFSPLSVLLSWQPPQDKPGTITAYVVTFWNMAEQQPHTGTLEVSAAAADNTALIHHLEEDIAYRFQVAARNANGTSPPSDIVQVTTGYERLQNVSFVLKASTLGPTEVLLTWSHPDVLHVAVVVYTVQYHPTTAPDQEHEEKVNGNTTTLTVPSLSPSTAYTFSLVAAIVTPDMSIVTVESNTVNATTEAADTSSSVVPSPSPGDIPGTATAYLPAVSSPWSSTTSPSSLNTPASTSPSSLNTPASTSPSSLNTPASLALQTEPPTASVLPFSSRTWTTTSPVQPHSPLPTQPPTPVIPASQFTTGPAIPPSTQFTPSATSISHESTSVQPVSTKMTPLEQVSSKMTPLEPFSTKMTPRELPCSASHQDYCLNGGSCYMLQLGQETTTFYCKCPSAWIGARCQNANIIGNNSPSTGAGEQTQKVSIAVAVSVLLVLVIVGMVILYYLRSCRNKHKQALSARSDRCGELGSFNNPMYGEENELQCTSSSAGSAAVAQVLQSLMQDFHNSLDDEGYTPLTYGCKTRTSAYESPYGDGDDSSYETLRGSSGYDDVGLVVPSRSSSTHNFNNPGYGCVVREIQA